MYIPLEPGEEVVAIVHRHWVFVALRAGLLVLLLCGLPLAVIVAGTWGVASLSLSPGLLLSLVGLWGIVLWLIFWQFWTTYMLDMWVVTSRRLIDIDYARMFDRNIAILELTNIQDVTTHVDGFFASTLGYGSVLVQTAGAGKEFVIDQIAEPEKLRSTIMFATRK